MPKAGKENVAPSASVREHDMSASQKSGSKRKADVRAPAPSPNKKSKSRATDDDDLEDADELKAENRRLRARIDELSSTFDELRKLRHTEPEKRIRDLLTTSEDVQRGLEAAVKEHKDELKRLRQRDASPDKRAAPASPAQATAPHIHHKQNGKGADSMTLQQARAEGAAAAEAQIRELEEQLREVQTRYAAEKKKNRAAAAGSAPETHEMSRSDADLLSDLSGFTILQTLVAPREDILREYSIILTDLGGRGISLHFRLCEHPDNTVSYVPDLDQSRDEILLELFQSRGKHFSSFMRFPGDKLSNWSKRLSVGSLSPQLPELCRS